MDDKLILSTISNLVYFFNYDATLQNSTNDSNLNNQLYTFKTLTNLKGFILSRNKLLKIAIGNAHKQKTHCSNIVISANIKYTMPVEEILLKLVISFKKKLHKNFTLKEPLNLDDLLCILAENHDIFIELVAFLKALLEEQNNLDSLVKIKKHSFNKQMLSLAKKKIDELVPNKELQNFILGRLFFNIIMIHKEDFAFFIKDAKRNFLDNFYKNLLKTNFNDIILKIQEENQKNLLENIKYNLKSFIADKSENSIEIEKICKICRKSGDCESNHTFLKCILTQEDIYLERIFSCSYCESALIDVESEFKLKSEYFDFYYNICPCCLHLMKYPLCQI